MGGQAEAPDAERAMADDAGRGSKGRLGVVVAVLIALASVGGALATWRLTRVSSTAGANDASAIDQTIVNSRDKSRAEVVAQTERSAFVRYQSERSAAVSLQRLGEQARQAGDVAGAASLTNEAQSLDEAAKALAAQYPYIAEQASTNKAADESATTFDLDGRRRALVLELQRRRAELDPSPGVAAAAAQRDRRHAERLALCIALFGASIFLLTIAGQLGKRVLPHVALIAALMLVATSVLTVVMW